MNKKGIGPVIASALFMIVAVVAVVGFQTWFNNYSSITLGNVETKSSNSVGSTQIEDIIDSTLYFKNGETTNLSIQSVTVGGYDCNIISNVSSGTNSLDLSACIYNLTAGSNDVVVITNKGIYNEKIYVTNVPILTPVTLSFSVNDSTIAYGENLTLTWTSSGATSCTASGDWNGSKATSGSEIVQAYINSTYNLSCTGGSGSVLNSTSISTYDPYWSNVVLLMHMEDSNGSTTFTDEKGHTFSVGTGTPIISTNTNYFGSSSLYLDGTTGEYIAAADSVDWDFSSSDFTGEFFIRFSSFISSVDNTIIGQWGPNTQEAWQFGYTSSSNNLLFPYTIDGSTNQLVTGPSWTPTFDQWYHLAYSREGTRLLFFVDGLLLGNYSIGSVTIFNSPVNLVIGMGNNYAPTSVDGFMDEIRITKGVARYTSNFTVPTAQFPNN